MAVIVGILLFGFMFVSMNNAYTSDSVRTVGGLIAEEYGLEYVSSEVDIWDPTDVTIKFKEFTLKS